MGNDSISRTEVFARATEPSVYEAAQRAVASLSMRTVLRPSNAVLRRLLLTFALLCLTAPAALAVPEIASAAFSVAQIPGLQVNVLPVNWITFSCIAVAYLLVLSTNRAWSLNEQDRTRRVFGLNTSDDNKELPDLLFDALLAAILLIPIIPIGLYVAAKASCDADTCLFRGPLDQMGPWVTYSFDTIVRALVFFDFPEIYDWKNPTRIEAANTWGAHTKMFVRSSIDILIIASAFEVLRIYRMHRDALATLEQTHQTASRVGSRLIPSLISVIKSFGVEDEQTSSKLTATTKKRLENAITAIAEIGDPIALPDLKAVIESRPKGHEAAANRAVKAIGRLLSHLIEQVAILKAGSQGWFARRRLRKLQNTIAKTRQWIRQRHEIEARQNQSGRVTASLADLISSLD
jgi:hypothetical protein